MAENSLCGSTLYIYSHYIDNLNKLLNDMSLKLKLLEKHMLCYQISQQ